MCGFNPCRETESYLAKIKLGSKGSSFFIPLLRVGRSPTRYVSAPRFEESADKRFVVFVYVKYIR